jgi:hypothetical protein
MQWSAKNTKPKVNHMKQVRASQRLTARLDASDILLRFEQALPTNLLPLRDCSRLLPVMMHRVCGWLG